MKIVRAAVFAAVLAAVALVHTMGMHAIASCETLSSLSLPLTTITLAQSVPAGDFSPPAGGPEAGQKLSDLPAFCRVAATLRPSSDSDIKIEVWMPTSGWNGKFQAVGNGSWVGTISYPAMSQALQRGYATSSTDTGHTGNSASVVLGHPEKVTDFSYRAVHEMTVTAKAIINSFYGTRPRYSYWNGCSTGGRQGLKEAQRFPNDYDGIVAGAPAADSASIWTGMMWVAHATLKDPVSYIPTSKYPMIHQAVVGACDALDGLKDGLIDDPRRCHFDPKVLACKSGDGPACLTAPQVEAARKILSPPIIPRLGMELYPGLEPGTELGWAAQAGGPEPAFNGVDRLKYVVFKNPNWDWRTFNFHTDVALADKIANDTVNAIDPNLHAFVQRGGKLLMYHGWSDQSIAPRNSINYYNRVMKTMDAAAKTTEWLRLFMVPGMAHCRGGQGPNSFDAVGAIEQWVEKRQAPDQIIASHSTDGKIDRTRPLCPYPQVARYKGTGNTDDAVNFVCKAP